MNCLLFQRILAIVGLGVVIGAADSWIRPTTLTLRLPTSEAGATQPGASDTPTQLPAKPAKSESPLSDSAVHATSPVSEASPSSPPADSKPQVATPSATAPLGLMIDSIAAKTLFDAGVIFLDARIDEEFRAGHVPQAYHLNSSLFGTAASAETMKVLDKSQPIVIYCGGGDCDASKNLAILLQGAGFTRLHIIEQGFPEWVSKGFPVEKETK